VSVKGRVSVLIPSRTERFLVPTVESLLQRAKGDIEVAVALDGYWPDPPLPEDPRVIAVHRGAPRGMRAGLNAAFAASSGEFVMKLDAHCLLSEGFDLELKKHCGETDVLVPRRYALDPDTWDRRRGRSPIDYQFLSYYENVGGSSSNDGDRGGIGLHGRTWDAKNKDPELKKKPVDELMSAQGSSYFLRRAYWEELELLDEANYGPFSSEFQEVGLKAWLGRGRVLRVKTTWYAHLHKGRRFGRGYPLSRRDSEKATAYTRKWITDEAWAKQERPFRWLIHRFWPVPEWPQEWAAP
jgi:glycosyltransferase involved in cell wall biosynthesis